MRTLLKTFVLSCAVIFIAGCQKEESPINGDPTPGLKAGKANVIESVTGSGHLTRFDYFNPEVWRTFSFNAEKRADGTVTGTYQINNHNLTHMIGKVICFTITGNQAVLIVQWEKYRSSVQEPLDAYGYIIVEDNGEGSKAAPDRISLHNYTTDLNDCSVLYELPLFEIEAGNIQIH